LASRGYFFRDSTQHPLVFTARYFCSNRYAAWAERLICRNLRDRRVSLFKVTVFNILEEAKSNNRIGDKNFFTLDRRRKLKNMNPAPEMEPVFYKHDS
jgi:hypothetical protein